MAIEREPGEHPSRKFWEEFIEEARFAGEDSREMAHLESCEVCLARVRKILEEERMLVELSKSERSREAGPLRETPPCVERNALWEYADWLAGRDPDTKAVAQAIPEELQEVEAHLKACDRCLTLLLGMEKLLARLDRA